MFNKIDLQGKKAVCLLSGGNIDVTILSRVLETKNFEHIAQIKQALRDFGFKLLQ